MIPSYVKPFVWSYDTKKLNLKKDRKVIIINILNLGSIRATEWLFEQFNKADIKKTIQNSSIKEWNEKSLNLWSNFLKVKPKKHVL